jgi:hypothetical protein
MRLYWITWLILTAVSARPITDVVRTIDIYQQYAAHQSLIVPHVPAIYVAISSFLAWSSQSLLYIGEAAIVEVLYRSWRGLRTGTIDLGGAT